MQKKKKLTKAEIRHKVELRRKRRKAANKRLKKPFTEAEREALLTRLKDVPVLEGNSLQAYLPGAC
jgi:hypothetical protein